MKIIADNKKERRNYEIFELYEAGIVLEGWEVKSARANKVSLNNSYCSINKEQMWLNESHFSQYMLVKCNEVRERKLLLHKEEIKKIKFKCESKQLTIIPTKIYFKKDKIKVEIALAKGLKKFDKREKIAKEEVQKNIKKKIMNALR
ncbi:SsrA-binding protein SmpB [Mycoplasma crocodyli]|uniref:SsrA-binding protein n=1 Tax=Mycoplasma crocodyli (strain ATCC 51981 / MP145) TaxID=512564 RepID=D5E4S1_MYCCM|nr:SsrA-binding protein SmpB [Mycoplasma crocodyli]ADE19693.1 SsrA RNA (tmRNA)-binding protein [Mycoplasma crocodyli MP145]